VEAEIIALTEVVKKTFAELAGAKGALRSMWLLTALWNPGFCWWSSEAEAGR